jgi:hypothetical protein
MQNFTFGSEMVSALVSLCSKRHFVGQKARNLMVLSLLVIEFGKRVKIKIK